MTRAQDVCDLVVRRAEATGFAGHGVHVLVGDDEAEHAWSGDERRDVHSVAKGICVLAASIAADRGLVDLHRPVAGLVPDVRLGDGVETVTLHHLLTMTSGVDLPWTETMLTDWPDLSVEYLGRASRGRVFQYSDASTYTAMRVLAEAVGDVGDFVDRTVFTPLGIEGVRWERCPLGRIAGGGGLPLRTAELARIGRLIRDRGVWRGTRLVSGERVDALHSGWVIAGRTPGYDRYARAGWGGPGPAWRLHGAHGQLVVFVADAVVTITADDHSGADAMAAFVVEAVTR